MINYNLKQTRKECREKALKYNQLWALAWDDKVGFYCVEEYTKTYLGRYKLTECRHDPNTICYVSKDGRFVCPVKKEYIKRFRLTDRQNQKGQKHNFQY